MRIDCFLFVQITCAYIPYVLYDCAISFSVVLLYHPASHSLSYTSYRYLLLPLCRNMAEERKGGGEERGGGGEEERRRRGWRRKASRGTGCTVSGDQGQFAHQVSPELRLTSLTAQSMQSTRLRQSVVKTLGPLTLKVCVCVCMYVCAHVGYFLPLSLSRSLCLRVSDRER